MPALTGIRLPLALWVLAHHISGPGRMLQPLVGASELATAFVGAAWVALSVFFAISGFVIARRYRTQHWSRVALGRYAMARFARIYPVYVLSILVLLPVIRDTFQNDALSVMEGGRLLITFVLLLQGWFSPTVNWNTPAWSLSSEVFFYAVAPAVVLLVRVPSWRRVIAAGALACAVPPLVRLLIEDPAPKALLYLGDFLIGVASAGLYERLQEGRRRRLGPRLCSIACVGGLMLLLVRDSLGPFLVFDTGVRIVSALLVTGLACGSGWLVRVLSSPTVLAGGQASYAMYILHIPVLWYYRRFGFDTVGHPVVAGIVYVVVVVVLSLIVARWYEAPANAALVAWWARRQQRGAPVAARPSAVAGLPW